MTPSPAITLLSDVLVRAIDRKGLSVILSDATNSTPLSLIHISEPTRQVR